MAKSKMKTPEGYYNLVESATKTGIDQHDIRARIKEFDGFVKNGFLYFSKGKVEKYGYEAN
ncbi:MAG: hypothetical protein IH795_04005 [Bacteroidetes bacterium]|nr:hypothetical protein [Bacteroidota bacterium]